MSGPPTILLALALAGALAQRTPSLHEETAVERLGRWVAELANGRASLAPEQLADAERVLSDVGLAWSAPGTDARAVAQPVLDLYGHLLAREHAGLGGGIASIAEERARQRAGELLSSRIGELRAWLTREVLPLARIHPVERRAAAARALERDRGAESLLALFTCTRDPERLVRDEAIAALAGRDDETVHALLLDLLEDAEGGRIAVRKGLIEQHFRSLKLAPVSPARARVAAYARRHLAGDDWRAASRAIAVARALDEALIAPMLIEALAVWRTREAGGKPSRRIQGDLVRELERRSGRRLGPHPERWRRWWEAVLAGDIDLEGHVDGTPSFSQASFFGLRPMTDRVVFVLDRSGSMETPFGESSASQGRAGRTRLREAAAQMSSCLEGLGEATRFDVVLFSDGARRWRGKLSPATNANVSAAAAWVLSNGTGGGTQLRAGIESALQLDARGLPVLDELEADTVIVLCDGETAEGPSWVRPLLRRANDDARIIFHAVCIGGANDGTLSALCDETGGDLVRVGG